MNNVNRKHTALPIAMILLCVSVLPRIGLGQEISAMRSHWGEDVSLPRNYAMDLFDHFELVADGEFYALPASTPEELRALKYEKLRVKFRIDKIYKAEGHPTDSIDIQLVSDMLAYPGESISRYAKRQQIMAKQAEDLKTVWEQYKAAEASYEAGEIEESEYFRVLGKYSELRQARRGRDGLSGRRRYVVFDAQTIYDKGGAIRAGEIYLIGVNRIENDTNVYLLQEIGRSRIYWGEMRDHILPGFDTLGEE